jgi:hypothetical protein
MAWVDEIASLQTRIDDCNTAIAWLSGTNQEYTVRGYTATVDGRDGFWAAWRTANPSASSSSTGDELANFNAWNEWNDANQGADWSAVTAEKITAMTSQRDAYISDRDNLQNNVDTGVVDAGA